MEMLNLIKDYDPSKITMKIMEMQKSAIDNTYESIIALQSQTEKMALSMIEQIPYLPQDSAKVMDEWTVACKKGQDEYKQSFDNSYQKLEDFFTEPQKTTSKPKAKQA